MSSPETGWTGQFSTIYFFCIFGSDVRTGRTGTGRTRLRNRTVRTGPAWSGTDPNRTEPTVSCKYLWYSDSTNPKCYSQQFQRKLVCVEVVRLWRGLRTSTAGIRLRIERPCNVYKSSVASCGANKVEEITDWNRAWAWVGARIHQKLFWDQLWEWFFARNPLW